MNTCIYCGCEITDSNSAMMHNTQNDCVTALKLANAELRRQLDELKATCKLILDDKESVTK
jgi:hypothetical protein